MTPAKRALSIGQRGRLGDGAGVGMHRAATKRVRSVLASFGRVDLFLAVGVADRLLTGDGDDA